MLGSCSSRLEALEGLVDVEEDAVDGRREGKGRGSA